MLCYNWGETNPRIDWLTGEIESIRVKVVTHPMYNKLSTIRAVSTFMEHHVFAPAHSHWKECGATINRALGARILRWDGILAAIEKQQAPMARSHR